MMVEALRRAQQSVYIIHIVNNGGTISSLSECVFWIKLTALFLLWLVAEYFPKCIFFPSTENHTTLPIVPNGGGTSARNRASLLCLMLHVVSEGQNMFTQRAAGRAQIRWLNPSREKWEQELKEMDESLK